MAYVQVPKDLAKVKTKVLFNLTKRQLICFGLAAATGIPVYFLTQKTMGATVSASLMVLTALPFFCFAMYDKDGRPLERILWHIVKWKFLRTGVRVYKTNNFYGNIQRELQRKENVISEKKKRRT
jgi:hypothetical protein